MKKKIILTAIIALAVGIAAGAVIGIAIGADSDMDKLTGSRLTVRVPNVEGQKEEDAKEQIENAGFKPETVYIESSVIPEGCVQKTDPAKDTPAGAGSTVRLFVVKNNSGSVAVPDVIGKDFNDAKNELTKLGFKVTEKLEDSAKEKGTVLLSSPLPGVKAPSGSEIILTVSTGRK